MKSFKYYILIVAVLLFSACTPRNPQPRGYVQTGKWASKNSSGKMWSGQSRRDSYNPSKPEPFSKESGQKDPEVLGPQ